MLTIRPEQLGALGAHFRGEFVERTLAMLAKHWPETFRTRGEESLRALVEATLAEAEGFGIRGQRDVMKLVNVKLALGDDALAKHAWIAELLGDAQLTAGERVTRVTDRAFDELA